MEKDNNIDFNEIHNSVSEMTKSQVDFLLNLIKENKPKKIVEIGVAAGATSTIILDFLDNRLDRSDYEMFSIDLSNQYYRDPCKKTGYYIEKYRNNGCVRGFHKLLLGEYAVSRIEEVGDEIDFLILDTVHSMPGEFLDFIAFLPYIKEGGCVVLHDICSNHMGPNPDAIATQLLMDVVSGNKLIDWTVDDGYPNIGAFTIKKETIKNIEDVFRCLMTTWRYVPCLHEYELYRSFYQKHYSEDLVTIYEKAYELNKRTDKMKKDKDVHKALEIFQFTTILNEHSQVYIYGAGDYGNRVYKFMKQCNIEIKGFIVSDDKPIEDAENISAPSIHLHEFEQYNNSNTLIVIGVSRKYHKEILNNLKCHKVDNYISFPEELAESIYVDFKG